MVMSGKKASAKPEVKNTEREVFKLMTGVEKSVHVLKVVVSLCTFCFVFPNVFAMTDTDFKG